MSSFTVESKSFPKGWWVETTMLPVMEDLGEGRSAHYAVWRVGLYLDGELKVYRDVHNLSRVEPLVAELKELIKGKEHG